MYLAKFKSIITSICKDTTFINILAFLFISLSITEVLSGITFTASGRRVAHFVENIIFLNTCHIGFSFFLLFEMKPFQLWRNEQNTRSNFLLEYKLISLFVLFALFFIVGQTYPKFVIFIAIAYSYFHVLKQHLGLFLESNYTNNHLNKTSEKKMRQLDHMFFNTFIFITWAWIFLDYWFSYLNVAYAQLSYLLCLLFYISYILITFGGKVLKTKLTFLPRILIYPLLPTHSIIAFTALGSIHGIEYFFVSKRLFTKPKKVFYSFGFLLFLIIITLCLLHSERGLFGLLNIQFPKPYNESVLIAVQSFVFLHYWLDGQIFKMKDPLVRKHIAPALRKMT